MLADRVLRTIRRHGMISGGRRVLVALSGGPDSTALTHLLLELHSRGELVVAGAAHLHHGLRPAADADEQFCRAVAEAAGLTCVCERADIRASAREQRTSIEAAAREVRYVFLERAASRIGADVVATGHTRDDQAETFLLRLIRGAGSRGLAGIYPVAGRVIRPLIDLRRHEVLAYLREGGHRYREDESNLDLSIPRNRVRHELIPYLQRSFSAGIVDVLAREADIARDDEDRLHHEAIELLESIVLRSGAGDGRGPADRVGHNLDIDADALTLLHPAIAARIVHHALRMVRGGFVGFDHVQRFLDFARDPGPTGKLTVAGRLAVRRGSRIVFEGARPQPFSNSFRVSLSIPGEAVLAPQGWVISAEQAGPDSGDRNATGRRDGTGTPLTVAVSRERLILPLGVRSRLPGDRFAPPGLGGKRKKLQDFFVDRKVPRETRDSVPLVVDGEDRIVWIVGHGVAEDFRVTAPAQGVILLKARHLGGEG